MDRDDMQDKFEDLRDSAEDKAQEVLPDDDAIEKASEKIQDFTPDSADTKVAKAEQWAKDHNKD